MTPRQCAALRTVLLCLFVIRSYAFPVRRIQNRHQSQHSLSSRSSAATTCCHATTTKVGFIGCGTIASAIATGIATQNQIPIDSIAVSRRSESKSQALVKSLSALSLDISVHDNNQEIVNQSDLIFLCVLPQQTSNVLEALEFDETKHTLISLVVSSISNPLWYIDQIDFDD